MEKPQISIQQYSHIFENGILKIYLDSKIIYEKPIPEFDVYEDTICEIKEKGINI